jgi:signal transduction histidine kinase
MTLEHSNWDSAMEYARGSDGPPETQEDLRWSEFRYRTVASMAPGFIFVQTLAARVSERFGVRVNFQSNFAEPLLLSETAATHVYRIVQEALTNVVRHGRATEVAIR